VLDEPTARLPQEEAAALIGRLQELKRRGLPILYITHRLEELRGFADQTTILRDGVEVYAGAFDALPHARLRELIAGLDPGTGSRPTASPPAPSPRGSGIALELRGVSSARLRAVDLTVHEGEIVAVTGLVGSGRSELGRVVYGLQRFTEGEIVLGAKTMRPPLSKARTALDSGYLPQERVASLLAGLSVADNVTVASFEGMSSWYGLVGKRVRAAADDMVRTLQIRPADPDGLVDVMSGGNAQKVAVARWLRIPLSLLVLDEPTQSIDVGAKTDLMEAIRERARATGMAGLWLESDIEEVVKYADRVIVMADGRIEAEFGAPPFSVAELVAHSYGRDTEEDPNR
jgi:ribose transport system ATP-binding protein